MKKYFVFVLLIFISFTACNDNSLIEEKELIDINSVSELQGMQNHTNITIDISDKDLSLPSCLDENVVDTFLYFSNEFTNYLLSADSINNFPDSTELAEMINSQGIDTKEEFYQFVSNKWNIPLDIVKKFGFYSKKVANQISRETPEHHPIASRYYELVKTGCLKSNLNPEFFEDDDFIVSMVRMPCPTYWDVLGSLAMAVITTAEAVECPSPWSIFGAVRSIVHYYDTVLKC